MKTNNSKNIQFLDQILKKMSVDDVCEKLSIHKGTLKRWQLLQQVPKQYLYDLYKLTDNQKDKIDFIETSSNRDKDQFFTKPTVSLYCINKTKEVLKELKINWNDYNYIEPSAGSGSFLNLLPVNKRIGIDIELQESKEIIKMDYLSYYPKSKKNIVIGNPPFGLRGNLALRFINHSLDFADVVAFILPPLFDSDGKGSPMKRIKGYKLAYSEKLPQDSFAYPNGKEIKISTLFQVWVKINTHLIKQDLPKTCDSYISVYSLSNGETASSKRNINMLDKCHVYLPSTTFKGMKAYSKFSYLPNNRGYGVVFKKNIKTLTKIFMNENWEKHSFLSTNSAFNLRTSIIKNVLILKGYYDTEK